MSMADYYKYLKVRDAALDVEEAYRKHCAAEGRRCVDPALGVPEEARFVTVTDQSRAPRVIDVLHELYYCIDFDLPKYLPELDADLTRNFAFDTLPSGRRCALRCVSSVPLLPTIPSKRSPPPLPRYVPKASQPFMGPNLYITPARAFTHLHQDGHGTVDSGHQCLTGYNEVVMLRRLDEVHMKVGLARARRRRPLRSHPTPFRTPSTSCAARPPSTTRCTTSRTTPGRSRTGPRSSTWRRCAKPGTARACSRSSRAST